jgi:hypothetical protein
LIPVATQSTVPNPTLSQNARLYKYVRLPNGWRYLRADYSETFGVKRQTQWLDSFSCLFFYRNVLLGGFHLFCQQNTRRRWGSNARRHSSEPGCGPAFRIIRVPLRQRADRELRPASTYKHRQEQSPRSHQNDLFYANTYSEWATVERRYTCFSSAVTAGIASSSSRI